MARTGDLRRQPVYVEPPVTPEQAAVRGDAELARVRRLARLLDRFGVDPILGLVVPGAGDIVGSMLGLYAVVVAVRRRVSPVVIARMLLNLALDAALGIVPLIGDLFDLAFKANQRNVALLIDRTHAGGRATARDWLAVVGAALLFLAAIGLTIYALVAVIRAVA